MAANIPTDLPSGPDFSVPDGEEPAINTGNRVFLNRHCPPAPHEGQTDEDDS